MRNNFEIRLIRVVRVFEYEFYLDGEFSRPKKKTK